MATKKEDKPLYQQVKTSILALIEENELRPGDLLPTEAELESIYQVSRTTIRTAISELQTEGYVTKHQGRGTFVANNSYEDCQAVLQSFTKDAQKRGITMRAVVISVELIIPDEELQNNMEMDSEPVLRIQRVRYIDEVPTILTTSYLPSHVHERMDWKSTDFSSCSLYEIMESHGVDFESGEEIVEVCSAGVYEAALLNVPVGYPLSRNQRKVSDKQGRLVEYGCSLTRGDRYRLYIKLIKRP
ncbi:MAG: GntR family transcriptional regulator [Clostridiaceae bacterium]|jgi:GntR family transcriptional regulator|nr:GntR family transcriptional regulator [Clostridiaceae bacterium]